MTLGELIKHLEKFSLTSQFLLGSALLICITGILGVSRFV